MKLDRNGVKILRATLDKALNELGLDGVTFEIGRITYERDGSKATMKITASTKAAADKADARLEEMLRLYRIKKVSPHGHTIVDYHPRKTKYPFIVEKDGVTYKMSHQQVQVYCA